MMREEARHEGLQGYEHLSDKLLAAIRAAGDVALETRERGLSSTTKSTAEDIVTDGDEAVSRELQRALTSLFPGIKIIDEEVAGSGNIDLMAEELVAIVDPIDGTGNYSRGSPNWGISVGIVKRGVPVAGIIYQPAEKKMCYAEKGRGTHVNGKRVHVSTTRSLADSHIRFELPYQKDENEYAHALRFNDKLKDSVSSLERRGSQVVCAVDVAEGAAWDVFFCMRTQMWDVAAAITIVTEAGGVALNGEGGPYSLGDKFVVLANNSLQMDSFFQAAAETV